MAIFNSYVCLPEGNCKSNLANKNKDFNNEGGI